MSVDALPPLFQPMQTAGLSADALRFCAPPLRQMLQAWFAWTHEIAQIPYTVSDVDVAQAKLAWWQQEVQSAVLTGRGNHPKLQPLLALLKEPQKLEPQAMTMLIEGYNQSLWQTRYLDEAALARHVQQTAQMQWMTAAKLCTPSTTSPIDLHGQVVEQADIHAFIAPLSQFFATSALLANLGWDARHDRMFVPISLLQQFDIKAHELLKVRQPLAQLPTDLQHRYRLLCNALVSQALQHLQNALAALPTEAWGAQKPLLIEASIRHRWLQQAQRSGFDLLHQQLQLSPFQQFWQAWKMQALNRF